MSFMSADFPTIPEDGGAFFNNPQCRNLALGRLAAPAAEAFMHNRIISLLSLNWYGRLRGKNDIRACAMAHMVVGSDPRARTLLAGAVRNKPHTANRYLMEAMRRIYNFPAPFSEVFYKAFDASYGKKEAAQSMVQAIACGTGLDAVAEDYTRRYGESFDRNSYKVLAAIIRAHAPAMLVELDAPTLKQRLNLA